MRHPLRILGLFSAFWVQVLLGQHSFQWEALPDLPPNPGQEIQPGLAGAFVGSSHETLILAGGANFPEALPWEGGVKHWWADIFVLERQGPTYEWKIVEEKLPHPMAYGVSITTDQGLYCMGGTDGEACFAETFFLGWDAEKKTIALNPGPELPFPLANMSGALVDGQIYLAGGQESPAGEATYHFLRLDLNAKSLQWEILPGWPGPPRAYAVAAAQFNGEHPAFYLFSGRNFGPDQPVSVLADGYRYLPFDQSWQKLDSSLHFPVMAGTAVPIGNSQILFLSGDDGQLMQKAQTLTDSALSQHLNQHPGFPRKLWAFNTITQSLHLADSLPHPTQVTTTAIPWERGFVLPSGEIRPGVRTPKIRKTTPPRFQNQLGWANSMVLILYFTLLVLMGIYFSTRQKTTEDYFKGGQRIPWWAAGLSIFGTALSAITFMAIPAKTFAVDWAYFILNMTIFLVAPIIVGVYLPFFRRQSITTAYEYLEQRFNLAVRIFGSLFFLLFQIGRMAIILFLPAIALNIVSGMDIFLCIGLMGLFSLVYTMMGGIEAVIWTDVLQVVILLGGAFLTVVFIAFSVDGGLSGIITEATQNQKFNLLNPALDLRTPTLWVMLLGGVFANLTTYGSDQTMVQRYLSTKDIEAAKKSVWTNAWMSIPASLLFFFIGTALYVFYRSFPEQLPIGMENTDSIFPWYIVSQLPPGVAGLLIAGIFAAAMSSLSSSMNSAATAYMTDIHLRFGWKSLGSSLRTARMATLFLGLIGTGTALLMAAQDIQSLWDQYNKVLGFITGGLGGVFLLGMVSKRAHGIGALCGIVGSAVVQYLLSVYQPFHLLMYSATGFVSCVVIGWLVSWMVPLPEREG